MGNIIFWAFCLATLLGFVLCGIDLAFNKDFNMSENLSAGMTLLASLFVLITTCTVIPNGDTTLFQDSNSGIISAINNAAAEAIPFYNFLANSKDGVGLLKYYSNDFHGFAEELLQTIFMASVIPMVNKLLPSTVLVQKKHHLYTNEEKNNILIMALAVNLITVSITMALYYFFQQTTIAKSILNIIVALCSMSPLLFIIRKIIFGTKKDLFVLTLMATFFGKAIATSIIYMVFIHEIAIRKADLIAGFNAFMYVIPSLAVCGIMIIGIFMCFRSILKP